MRRILSTYMIAFVLMASFLHSATAQTYGTGPVQIGLTSISAIYSPTDISFRLGFANPVAAPSADKPNSVYGYIDLDVDRNPGTGIVSDVQNLGDGPPLALGEDYYIDLGTEEYHPGTVDIVDAVAGNPTGDVPVAYGGATVTLTVPLALIGNGSGLLNYAAIVGTSTEATSELPTGSAPFVSVSASPSSVPEPSAIVALGTATFCLIALSLGMRRRMLRANERPEFPK